MTLDDIDEGSRVLVDANILLYYASGASPQCRRLLRRGERGELSLMMSAATAAEARHGLMLAEARSRGLVPGSNPARRLRESPDLVSRLSDYLRLEADLRSTLALVDLSGEILAGAGPVSRDFGLLTNDAILASTARVHGITVLASADRDFERVTGLELYTPDDLV